MHENLGVCRRLFQAYAAAAKSFNFQEVCKTIRRGYARSNVAGSKVGLSQRLRFYLDLRRKRTGSLMTRGLLSNKRFVYVSKPLRRRAHLYVSVGEPHFIRHTTAVHLLQAGIATPVIVFWPGHEHHATAHQYIEADLLMSEAPLQHFPRD